QFHQLTFGWQHRRKRPAFLLRGGPLEFFGIRLANASSRLLAADGADPPANVGLRPISPHTANP
ncbi:MAG TPA: hypothetical protein VFA40_21975, partial [Terriglobales bacterium]|nr:hypothetical protein [Terriglobales bacterium]